MYLRYLTAASLLFAFLTAHAAAKLDISTLPEDFQATIPSKLGNDIQLEKLEDRCKKCEPWKIIEYFSDEQEDPIKRDKVSVQTGYKAIYTSADARFYSDTAIDKSVDGKYDEDMNVIIDALEHEYNRKKGRVAGYMSTTASLSDKTDKKKKGQYYLSFEQDHINRYEYVSYIENVVNIPNSTVIQIHIFVPERDIIISANLLRKDKSGTSKADELLRLKNEFIKNYTLFLKKRRMGKI